MFFLSWIRAYEREVLEENYKRFACHYKFLGSLVDDEEAIMA
jgi:hypothetical protein